MTSSYSWLVFIIFPNCPFLSSSQYGAVPLDHTSFSSMSSSNLPQVVLKCSIVVLCHPWEPHVVLTSFSSKPKVVQSHPKKFFKCFICSSFIGHSISIKHSAPLIFFSFLRGSTVISNDNYSVVRATCISASEYW